MAIIPVPDSPTGRPGRPREAFSFSPAAREEVRFKGSLQSAAGGGKTLSSLLLAYGITRAWPRIAFADTENGSAKQYAGQVFGDTAIPSGPASFNHCELGPPYDCDRIIALVEHVSEATLTHTPGTPAGTPAFDCLILDSLSHTWEGSGGVLERVDQIGKLDGWKVMGPKLRKMVDAIRLSRLHIVACLRTKTEYQIDSTYDASTGKQRVTGMQKIGTKPVFRDGLDYEFTTCFRLADTHQATVDKDRTNLFADRPPHLLGPADGQTIADWCTGAACQIGSTEWINLRTAELAAYGGSIDGLATLWAGTAGAKHRISQADWAKLVLAKDASKARLTDSGATATRPAAP